MVQRRKGILLQQKSKILRLCVKKNDTQVHQFFIIQADRTQ